MKKLKLDHHLADLVRSGKKTATWRMYDDKDISVNDELEFIDKVNPKDPDTWQPAGTAIVDKVIEVRMREMKAFDAEGHAAYESDEAMLQAFQKYYGPQVTLDTPVKMIHFTLQKNKPAAQSQADLLPHLKEAKLYADGGSRGNPGPSASGFVILDMDDQLIDKEGVYLGVTTNNQAEYQALKLGIEHARKMGIQTLHVYMDSLLVINQMKGIFKVKNRDLWPIHEAIKKQVPNFKQVTLQHVPRALNKLADGAVNETLDAVAKRQ